MTPATFVCPQGRMHLPKLKYLRCQWWLGPDRQCGCIAIYLSEHKEYAPRRLLCPYHALQSFPPAYHQLPAVYEVN